MARTARTTTRTADLAPQHPEHLGWTRREDAEAALLLRPRGVLLALLGDGWAGDWVEADEAEGQEVLVWGVSSRTGESMLDERNRWVRVA